MADNDLSTIARLENDLWEAADNLRANSKLTSTQYCMPVLGIIFLRHATNRFDAVTHELESAQAAGTMPRRKLIKSDYVRRRALWLPEEARYDYLLRMPADTNLGEALVKAMDDIEDSFPALKDQLPKEYTIFERSVLEDLLRTFDRESLRTANGDVFGRIYEYFLMKFSMQGAQDNGEFFTPPSLVQTIVNVIEPKKGIVFDPAAGSGGMFVQSSYFVEHLGKDAAHNLTFYGQEKTEATIKFAKMNMAVHGLEGDIREANTFYDDVHSLLGKCDYVMANPPFNVDFVDAEKIRNDKRLPLGLPGVNKNKKVSNANYLWIQYFYSYLNETGRSGFVMASSASDAGGDDKVIRQKLVESGHVDVIIAIGTNFFYTRTLPCTLWFFDKGKPTERQDKVLMIDARGIHRKVTRAINDFSPEQLHNIISIVWLMRGESDRYLNLVRDYLNSAHEAAVDLERHCIAFTEQMGQLIVHLETFGKSLTEPNGEDVEAIGEYQTTLGELRQTWDKCRSEQNVTFAAIDTYNAWIESVSLETNDMQHEAYNRFELVSEQIRTLRRMTDHVLKTAESVHDIAIKRLSASRSDAWETGDIRRLHRVLIRSLRDDEGDNLRKLLINAFRLPTYFHRQTQWLQSKFPNAQFADVEGLCKAVDRKAIEEQDWSLTPGRYVGVAAIEDDPEFDFEQTLLDIHIELEELNAKAVELATKITRNFEDLEI